MNNILPATAVPCPNVYSVDVTPDLASNWLEANQFNRPVHASTVAHLAEQMKSGHWRQTRCAIIFTKEGVLLDGIHRLHAVVRAGITVPMVVLIEETKNSTQNSLKTE